MTPYEIGLTVAVGSAGIALIAIVTAYFAIEAANEANARSAKNYADITKAFQSMEKMAAQDIIDTDAIIEQRKQLALLKAEVAQFIKLASASEEKRDKSLAELRAAVQELSAQRLPVHASHELVTAIEQRTEALEKQVAGMMVSQIALKPFASLPDDYPMTSASSAIQDIGLTNFDLTGPDDDDQQTERMEDKPFEWPVPAFEPHDDEPPARGVAR